MYHWKNNLIVKIHRMIAYTSKNFQINTSIDLKVFEQLFFNESLKELQFGIQNLTFGCTLEFQRRTRSSRCKRHCKM